VRVSVILFGGAWRVFDGARWRGRFDYQVDAIEAAIRLIDSAEDSEAELWVQDRFGELRMQPFLSVRPASPRQASAR